MLATFPRYNFSLEFQEILSQKHIMLSLTERAWYFPNNALWDTHKHALFGVGAIRLGYQ